MEFHKVLIKYRVIYFIITFFFLVLGWRAWIFYEKNFSIMSEAATAGFGVIFIAIIAALRYVLENLNKDKNHD